MKLNNWLLLVLSVLAVSCRPSTAQSVSRICTRSCDDIISQLGKVSNSVDEAVLAARSADKIDDAGRLFMRSDDHLDDLSNLLRKDIAVQEVNPVQLADEIMRSSSQYSDDLSRLESWAENTDEGIEFFGNLACSYRKAYQQSWISSNRNPYLEEIGAVFISSYVNAPPDVAELSEDWNDLLSGLQNNEVNIWDSSITLYCLISDLPEFEQ